MAKRGRPRVEIDRDKLLRLAQIGCTREEIAASLGISIDTLRDNFSDLIEQGKNLGKKGLRTALWKAALEGNIKALTFLAKNELGMSERVQTDHTSGGQPLGQVVIGIPDNGRDSAGGA